MQPTWPDTGLTPGRIDLVSAQPGYSLLMFNGFWRPPWLGRGRDPLRAAFGYLEREIMDVIWRAGRSSVRDVQGQLPRRIAYTTVMTTLDRLFKKGFVDRVREGRAFMYTAAHTREQVEAAVAAGLLTGFLQQDGIRARPLLSNLVDVVAERDGALLDELEALVREKRRRVRSAAAPDKAGRR
jgi:predicted transcriptional regulator